MKLQSMEGFSLTEVMIAMVISGLALMGTIGTLDLSSRQLSQGSLSTRALALAQGRLEAKRSVLWQALLEDDLDQDGVPEVRMKDDGTGGDVMAGDGVYSAMREQNGVTLLWTLQADRPGPLASARVVAIHVTASYAGRTVQKTLRLGTLRANPSYVGPR